MKTRAFISWAALALLATACGKQEKSDPQRDVTIEPVGGGKGDTVTIVGAGTVDGGAPGRVVTGGKTVEKPGTVQQSVTKGWHGQFFNNRDLLGAPAWTADFTGINFNWQEGSPLPGRVNSDNFSARFINNSYFQGGKYLLTVRNDDGVRVYVNGRKELDDWTEQAVEYNEYRVVHLNHGLNTIMVEYLELAGKAELYLSLNPYNGEIVGPTPVIPVIPGPAPVLPSDGSWLAEYFAGRLDGERRVTYETNIDHNWGTGGPGILGGRRDQFSVRWTKTLYLAGGDYKLTARSDDGMRVIVDGNLRIDLWGVHSVTEQELTIPLGAGQHTVIVEYFEEGGDASAFFSIKNVAECPTLKANIIACAAPWTESNNSYLNFCKVENGVCVSEVSTRTSYASDGGVIKIDGLEFNACTPPHLRPIFRVTAHGPISGSEDVQLVREGDIHVGFCR